MPHVSTSTYFLSCNFQAWAQALKSWALTKENQKDKVHDLSRLSLSVWKFKYLIAADAFITFLFVRNPRSTSHSRPFVSSLDKTFYLWVYSLVFWRLKTWSINVLSGCLQPYRVQSPQEALPKIDASGVQNWQNCVGRLKIASEVGIVQKQSC